MKNSSEKIVKNFRAAQSSTHAVKLKQGAYMFTVHDEQVLFL